MLVNAASNVDRHVCKPHTYKRSFSYYNNPISHLKYIYDFLPLKDCSRFERNLGRGSRDA